MKKLLRLLLLVLAALAIVNVAAGTDTYVVRQSNIAVNLVNGTLIGVNATTGVPEPPRYGMEDGVSFGIYNYPEAGVIFRVTLDNRGDKPVLVKVIMNDEEEWRGTEVALQPTERHNISYFGGYDDRSKYNVSAFSFKVFTSLSRAPYINITYDQDEDVIKTLIRNDDNLVTLRFIGTMTGPESVKRLDFELGPGNHYSASETPEKNGVYTLNLNYTDMSTGVLYGIEVNVSVKKIPKPQIPKVPGFGFFLGTAIILGIAVLLRKR